MFRKFFAMHSMTKNVDDHDIEKGWDVEVVVAPTFVYCDIHRSGSGVRTHACVNTSELKSDPLDQLGHPAMMSATLIDDWTDD